MLFTPEISVCMPMHNASRYLRESIGSVLAQTYADFEFLIADDGSTDDSVAIVESYSDPRIRLIKRPHDYIATLNCLLDEARGKYIARMDADDVMLPHRLQIQFDYMETHPDVDLLGCDTISIDEDYSPADTQPIIRNITFRDFVETNQLNHPTVFIRSEALNRYSLRYDNRYIYAEDYKLWSEFAKCGCRIIGMGVPVLRYRIHSEQASEREAAKQIQLKLQIQRENRLYAVNKVNPSYSKPKIWSTDNELTIIIPFLNEGIEVVNTVASIREYAGNTVDIVVINDSSYDGIDYGSLLAPHNVYYFVNYEHSGVAASRDMGVSLCKTPYFLLLDAHMRFYEAECFDTICRLLSENDRRLLCCQSVPIIPNERGVLTKQNDYRYAYGAYMPFDMSSLWPDIRWNNYEKSPGADIEQIELVLGAGRCYADYTQNIVINYDGLVYKCTARDFTADNAEGRLLSDGTVEWNKTSQKREQLKFGDETCRACPILYCANILRNITNQIINLNFSSIMKRKDMLAALKDRIQPLENSEAGLLCGGFTEIGLGTLQSGEDNGKCSENGSCYNNPDCSNNGSCGSNPGCSSNGACSRNGLCAVNVDCSNNSTCNNNSISKGNDSCNGKPTDSAGNDILDYSTIF